MALSDERRASLKAYCRIDSSAADEMALLETLYDAAVGYMSSAGVSEPAEDTTRRAQYDLCINALVLDAWDSRGSSLSGAVAENPSFRRLLNQLKLTEPGPVSESDT